MRGSVYRGDRRGNAPAVLVNGRPLLLPEELRPGDGYGYDWGRVSPGARWLALALLADATADVRAARRWYVTYACEVVDRLGADHWELTTSDVLRWLVREYESAERGRR